MNYKEIVNLQFRSVKGFRNFVTSILQNGKSKSILFAFLALGGINASCDQETATYNTQGDIQQLPKTDETKAQKENAVFTPNGDQLPQEFEQDTNFSNLGREAKVIGGGMILETISIRYDERIIEIRSKILKDSISDEEPNMFAPIPLDQSIVIRSSDHKIIKELKHPVSRVELKTSKGKLVNLLDNMIVSVSIIEGTKGAVIFVQGYGGCLSCTEFFETIDFDGNVLGVIYRTNQNIIRSDLDFKAVADRIGANDSDFFSKKNPIVEINGSNWDKYMDASQSKK